jgi:hypothetical protein
MENDVLATYQRTSFSGRRDVCETLGKHQLAQFAIHSCCFKFTGYPLSRQAVTNLCNQALERLFCLLKAKLRATVLMVAALGFIQRSSAGHRQVLYSMASLVSA